MSWIKNIPDQNILLGPIFQKFQALTMHMKHNGDIKTSLLQLSDKLNVTSFSVTCF